MANHLTLEDLTKGNIWTVTEFELNQMLIEGKKNEDYAENKAHYMNIIRPVFDIVYLNREDTDMVNKYEALHYEIFYAPNDGDNNAIAIRKRRINKITDLNHENISHIDADELLKLIENNLGTGWKGLPLHIQDIIEQAFYVDSSVLPATTMHRAGGLIERRRNDGYEVLEIERGNWIEGVFVKPKPRVEKLRFESITSSSSEDEDIDDDSSVDDEDDDSRGKGKYKLRSKDSTPIDDEEDDMEETEIEPEDNQIEDLQVVDFDDDED